MLCEVEMTADVYFIIAPRVVNLAQLEQQIGTGTAHPAWRNSTKPIRSTAGEGAGQCSVTPTDLWGAWVLTETAWRTFLVAGITMNVYDFLRDSWTACIRLVILTAQKGLWDASSAAR
jgi:hypothetical protein